MFFLNLRRPKTTENLRLYICITFESCSPFLPGVWWFSAFCCSHRPRHLDEPLLTRPLFSISSWHSISWTREVNLYFLNIPSLYYLLRASRREIMRMRDIRTQSMNALNRTKLHKGEPFKIGFISRGNFSRSNAKLSYFISRYHLRRLME